MPNQTCTAEIGFRDFDGSSASMPCGQPATRQITTRSAWLQDGVRSEGGWDAYRDHALHDGEDDPGEDPGEDKWGDDTELLCETHARECREQEGTDAPYDYAIIADETLLPVTEEERKAREHRELYASLEQAGHNVSAWADDPSMLRSYARLVEEQEEERRISRSQ